MSANALPIHSTDAPISPLTITPGESLPQLALIHLGISHPTDPDFVDVIVPEGQRYLSIVEGASGTIEWLLDGNDTQNATFDNPAITFDGNAGPSLNVTV